MLTFDQSIRVTADELAYQLKAKASNLRQQLNHACKKDNIHSSEYQTFVKSIENFLQEYLVDYVKEQHRKEAKQKERNQIQGRFIQMLLDEINENKL